MKTSGRAISLLILIPSRDRGGNEEYALAVGAASVRRGSSVWAGFPHCPGTATLREDFYRSGVECIDVDLSVDWRRTRFGICSDLRDFVRTLLLLRKLRPSAVHVVLPWPLFGYGSIVAAAVLRVPTAVVFQLAPYRISVVRWKCGIYGWARRRGQRWVAISENNRQVLCESFGVSTADVQVIYNGTRKATADNEPQEARERLRREVRSEFGMPEDALLLATVGRLNSQKGYADLVVTIPHLVRSWPKIRFLWVGDGPQRVELRQLLREYGVEALVHMVGHRSDVRRLLRAADLFIFPTRFEGGQSFALIEAMAEGVPIVSSAASGIPEVVANGVHGLLYRTGDTCDLLEAIRWALENPSAMIRMADAALKRVAEFSDQRMLEDTLNLHDELRQSPSGRGG